MEVRDMVVHKPNCDLAFEQARLVDVQPFVWRLASVYDYTSRSVRLRVARVSAALHFRPHVR